MILTRSELAELSGVNLIEESRREERLFSDLTSSVRVFLSHKHDDKQVLLSIKRILEVCGANPYVDWMDCNMPPITNALTAKKLKCKIDESQKFIFIATVDSLGSPWCNWEIGYGDAQKYNKKAIAVFPVKEDNGTWEHNEYLQQYPVIEYRDGSTQYISGKQVKEGYYHIVPNKDGTNHLTPLKQWLLEGITTGKVF